MTTEKAPAAEAAQSREDKFFGVTTSIDDMVPESEGKDVEDDILIEEADQEEQLATPDKPAVKAVEAGATDADIDTHLSKNVQKRIDKLTWEKNEERRARVAVEAERNEAFRVAKQLHGQTQQQAQVISSGEARLVDEIKSRAQSEVSIANAKYKKAYEEGDSDSIIEAQNELITAQAENRAAQQYDTEYRQRVASWAASQQQRQQQQRYQAQRPPQQPPQQQQRQPQPPTKESVGWASRNPWFGKNEHRDMTAIAYATHETMIRDQGIAPDSDEYYQKLDATMLQRFPEYFNAEQGTGQPVSSASRPHTVVAPATRGGAKQRTVKLKPSERSLAKALGITEKQYARQLMKENKRG